MHEPWYGVPTMESSLTVTAIGAVLVTKVPDGC